MVTWFNLIGMNEFSLQFRKIMTRYIRIGYNLNVWGSLHVYFLTQSCLIKTCCLFTLHAGGSNVNVKLYILVGWGRSLLSVAWFTRVQLVFSFRSEFKVIRRRGISIVGQFTEYVSLCFDSSLWYSCSGIACNRFVPF